MSKNLKLICARVKHFITRVFPLTLQYKGFNNVLNTFSGRSPSQNEKELGGFVYFMREQNCKRYCEIGARQGDTFHHIMSALGKDARGVAVDLPGGAWGRQDSGQYLHKAVQDLEDNGFNDVHVILGSSHDDETIELVRIQSIFDFILIDADHTYRAVKRDFNTFKSMATYLAFHDIVGVTQGTNFAGQRLNVEVPKLWAELKESHEHWEFVASGSQMGIGVIKTKS